MDNPLLILADHAASWRSRKLEPELEHHTRRALIDWFGVMLPGCLKPPATLLARALAGERGDGKAVCYVDGRRGGLRHAALINATASHIIEFDDIYRNAVYHPAVATMAAALATAQTRGASFNAMLRAIVAGYEVSCRIGVAVQPSHYRMWHTTGTVGTFAAATATAVLLDCDAERTAHAIATAGTFASGLQQGFRGAGMSKPLHPGHASEAGALAALAASAGITGALEVLHGPVGFAAATSDSTGDWNRALADLGQRYAISEMTFKNHGCCGHIFASLDAVNDLRREHGFSADDVAHISVEGYGATKDICDRPKVATEQEARFSLQYCMAALLLTGGVRLAAYTPEQLASPAMRRIMAKVSVESAPDLVAAYPQRRSARVEVQLNDGRVLKRYQPTRKGDPDAPLSDDELSAKFMELASPAIGDRAAGLLQSLWTGDQLPGEIPLLNVAA